MQHPRLKYSHLMPVLHNLKHIIGHNNWFISGSFANSVVDEPSDIDIYFYTENDFNRAVAHVNKHNKYQQYYSNNAVTFAHPNTGEIVQLIHKNFGYPLDIFKTFDLNVCKKAIRSDGTFIEANSAKEALHITDASSSTFHRYMKYLNRYNFSTGEIERMGKGIIDKYIADTSMVECYYGKTTNKPCNLLMYQAFKKCAPLKQYLNEQALEHAPELLV